MKEITPILPSEAVLYSSSDENSKDLGVTGVDGVLDISLSMIAGTELVLSSRCSFSSRVLVKIGFGGNSSRPAAFRMADIQFVRIPEVTADNVCLMSFHNCKVQLI